MKKSFASLALTLLIGSASFANASYRNYQPSSGAPYVGGASSFDWSNWSYVDGVLTNNAGSNRTWTVPMTVDNAVSGSAHNAYGVMKVANAGQGTNTGQAVANNLNGIRTYSGSVISPTCGGAGTYCDTFLGSVTYPNEGTVYVNYVVGNGNSIARTQIDQ